MSGPQGHKQIGGALFALDVETGEAELLLDNWNGLRFNSPNDLAVRSCCQHCCSQKRSSMPNRQCMTGSCLCI
jgi:hypothetical protein